MRIDNMPLGKVVSINGQKFAKVRNDLVNGSQFVALEKVKVPCFANQFNGVNMQDFTAENCDCLPKPTGIGYILAGIMRDARDGKTYEIRKFADGKCWMVDNLKYGGTTDACINKTSFAGNGSATPSNTFGAGTYGECRNNPSSATYGYLYSWQAAMQHASAYHNTTYNGSTTNVQGICPAGWHVPSGNTGEFQALHTIAGSPATSFWQAGGSWKGVFSGFCTYNGGLRNQNSEGFYWSSTQHNTVYAYLFYFAGNKVNPPGDSGKDYGLAVRCIKN